MKKLSHLSLCMISITGPESTKASIFRENCVSAHSAVDCFVVLTTPGTVSLSLNADAAASFLCSGFRYAATWEFRRESEIKTQNRPLVLPKNAKKRESAEILLFLAFFALIFKPLRGRAAFPTAVFPGSFPGSLLPVPVRSQIRSETKMLRKSSPLT